ncbi:MAG: FMN-binding protein [Acidimicrobiales bacterium]
MRRAPIVIGATIAGLAGVLTFHTRSASLALGSLPGASATRGSSPSTSVAGAPPSASTTTPSPGTSPAGTGPAGTSPTTTPSSTVPPTTTPTTAPATTRTATGDTVDYTYGSLSVSVTASGSRITKVGIASLNDGGSFRSQSIDQQSIPILEQQALQAQSANIQGVSGASYTSAGFENSLQSALGKLGL